VSLARTPLWDWHTAHGATLVPFAGWEMPLQYTGIVEEHAAVRTAAGLFDVSHMGKLLIRGEGALESANRLSTNDLPSKPGRARYAHLCDDQGRILDDVIFTTLGPAEVFCVCNAGTRARVVEWMRGHLLGAELVDLTVEFLCLAFQGPRALRLLKDLLDADPTAAKPFGGLIASWRGVAGAETVGWEGLGSAMLDSARTGAPHPFLVTRTGYTGEEGVELFPHRSIGERVWEEILAAGQEVGVRPIGLGARDTLRLEKGYLLSGQDFDGTRTPLEAGCEWLVKWEHEFIGREALRRQKDAGDHERLVGIRLEDRGVPRHGCEILREGRRIGTLTSGTLSPTLRRGVGLGYVPPDAAVPGTTVAVRVRDRDIPSKVVKPPFL